MFLKYSFVLRILLKAAILLGLTYLVQYFIADVFFFEQNWYYILAGAISIAITEDKIGIERKHTLIFLPIKSDLSAFEWLEKREYELMRKTRNRRVYVDRSSSWFERHDFVRITLMENKLKLKMKNSMAKEFEEDFIAVMTESD